MDERPSFLNPQQLSTPGALFSHGVLVTQPSAWLFIAGQIATTTDGQIVGENDIAAQARQVYLNIGVVLSDAAMNYRDLVKLTTYVVGAENLPAFVATRAEMYPGLFGDGPYPTNTMVVVDRLARPQCLVEIEAVAVRS